MIGTRTGEAWRWLDVCRGGLLLGALLLTSGVTLAQDMEPDPAGAVAASRERLAAAEALAREGRLDEAGELLLASLESCGDDACTIRAATSLGWLAGLRARAEPARAADWRERSVAYYRQAHALRPRHPKLLSNLVLALRDAGHPAEAADLWRQAGVSGSSSDLILLGDLYRSAGAVDEARAAYFRAEKERPADTELHRRLLQTYRLQPGDANEHWRWCERLWQLGQHALAAQGLERLLATPSSHWSEQALVRWAEQKALAGVLGPEDLASLREHLAPGNLPDDAVEGLASLLNDSDPLAPWWRRSLARREVAARVLTTRSSLLVAAGEADLAVRVLEAARRMAPKPGELRFEGDLVDGGTAWIDATVEIASLYRALRRNQQFRSLENQLFSAKGQAYLGNDLESIYRLHTVLGMIYAEDKRWIGGKFTNALFQLEHALSASEKLARTKGRAPPPLPHLRIQLAEGQRATGSTAKAGESYRVAAMEYLQLDDAAASLDAIAKAERLEPHPSLDGLKRIARTRVRLARSDLVPSLQLTHLLTSPQVLSLPKDFVRNQQFKIYSDLAIKARDADQMDLSLDYSIRALSKAPQDSSQLLRADAVRIQTILPDLDLKSAGSLQLLAVDESQLRRKLENSDALKQQRYDG